MFNSTKIARIMSIEVASLQRRVYVKDLSFDHELWDNEMKFYRHELEIFDRRLEQDVSRITDHDALRELEHFQNQFIRQNEVLDILNKKVRKNRKNLSRAAVEGEIENDHLFVHGYTELREEFEMFEKIYSDLKKKFVDFNHNWF